jgi:hypothetical protein
VYVYVGGGGAAGLYSYPTVKISHDAYSLLAVVRATVWIGMCSPAIYVFNSCYETDPFTL